MDEVTRALARLVQQLDAIDFRDKHGQSDDCMAALIDARELLRRRGVDPADFAPKATVDAPRPPDR